MIRVHGYLGTITDAVSAYYDGDLAAPSRISVVQRSGGTFLGPAWDALRLVEAGNPVTYTRFAELAGQPAAALKPAPSGQRSPRSAAQVGRCPPSCSQNRRLS